MRAIARIGRLLTLTFGLAAALTVTWTLAGPPARALVQAARSGRLLADTWTLDDLVGDVAAVLVLVAVTVLVALAAASLTSMLAAARLPRVSRLVDRITPSVLRRLVALTCGIGLAAPTLAPMSAVALPQSAVNLTAAIAGTGSQHGCPAPCSRIADQVAGLRLPDLPVAGGAHPKASGASSPERVSVRRGDSLWSIAAGRLPADASIAHIAALTTRLYSLNRATIGADPDLILPGTTLIAPEATS